MIITAELLKAVTDEEFKVLYRNHFNLEERRAVKIVFDEDASSEAYYAEMARRREKNPHFTVKYKKEKQKKEQDKPKKSSIHDTYEPDWEELGIPVDCDGTPLGIGWDD